MEYIRCPKDLQDSCLPNHPRRQAQPRSAWCFFQGTTGDWTSRMVLPCWFRVTQIHFMNGSSAKNICPQPSHPRGGCVNFYLVWYMPWKVHAIIMSASPPHSGWLSQCLIHNRCSINILQNKCLKEWVTSQISNYGFPSQIPRSSSFFWVAKRDFHVPKPSSHWPDRWCAESLSRRNKHASRFSWE